jgi:murein DD-endopeptidase MepM/ murein hydrolase activator NlpD
MNGSDLNFEQYTFAPVMDYPRDYGELYVFDFTDGYNPELIRTKQWGIGRYDEQRVNMYDTALFNSERNLHVGIDIWAPPGAPVYSFYEGQVAYQANNDNDGDYGPTIVMKHQLGDQTVYALYGHLSMESLNMVSNDDSIAKGQQIATLGTPEVNGGWVSHLHFQLSLEDPGRADMPGVVAPENRTQALRQYPDPRLVLGEVY